MEPADDIITEFLSETRENLEQFDRDIVLLETNPSAHDSLNQAFRTLHTLKGASSFLGFVQLEAMANAGESLLSLLRNRHLQPDSTVTAVLLNLGDCLRSGLVEIEATGCEGANIGEAVISEIRHLIKRRDSEKRLLAGAPPDELPPADDRDAAKPIGRLLIERAGVDPSAVALARELQRQGDMRTLGEILVANGAVNAVLARQVVEYQHHARGAPAADSRVRVDAACLDRITTLVDELSALPAELTGIAATRCLPALHEIAERADHTTAGLRKELERARMQQILVLWDRLPRLVRDLALAAGKQVRLQLEGGEVEVERWILDAVKDPLQHLIRNAIDHGIELPAHRSAAGKSLAGRLTLRACRSEQQVVIEVCDDGAGTDLERLKRSALARGLIYENQLARLSHPDTLALVFCNGVTTSARVTSISGRGVGMDIVKTNVENIGGSVELETEAGKGTTVTLRIPLPSAAPELPPTSRQGCGEWVSVAAGLSTP